MKLILLALFFPLACSALTVQDPTGGKPFFPWLWDDQFKPTIVNSVDVGGLSIVGAGAVSTVVSHQYDDSVQRYETLHPMMDSSTSSFFSTLGGGGLGIGITAVQLFLDQKNGLKHGRAIAMTALSHVTIAFIAHRSRPPGRDDYLPFASSFPSGHSSSAFATAESMAYAYGWWVGVPMNALAIAISASRVSENAHWFSDVVAGAALGLFWAHASNRADELGQVKPAWQVMPVPFEDGLAVSLSRNF